MLTNKEKINLRRKYNFVKQNYDYINSFSLENVNAETVLNLQLAIDELYYITCVIYKSFKLKRFLSKEEMKFYKNVNYNSRLDLKKYKYKIINDFIKENKIPEIPYDLLKLYENCGNLFN